MSTSSKRAPVKMEVLEMNEETVDGADESEVNELCCLSGDKPFFDVILSKSHVESPYCLMVPSHIAPVFPRGDVATVVRHGAKQWSMVYHPRPKRHYFEYSDWKRFVGDNHLKVGDACIFEVVESSCVIVRLRVLILRNPIQLPPELDAAGNTLETAILID